MYTPGKLTLPIEFSSCVISDPNTLDVTYSVPDGSDVQIIVSDVFGNRVSEVNCNSNIKEKAIDVSRLNNGIYIVTLVVDGAYIESKRIKI